MKNEWDIFKIQKTTLFMAHSFVQFSYRIKQTGN